MPEAPSLLYVEADPAGLALVAPLIEARTDLVLLSAANAKSAIRLARSCRPEVILLSIDVPGLHAVGFMKLLRADPALRMVPVLALSAHAEPAAMTRALEAGFFSYLVKPLKVGPFIEALEYALEFAALERKEQNPVAARRAGHALP